MESRMVRRLVIMGVAVALTMAVALPARAGPSMVEKMMGGFYTSALQGNGTFQWVFCSQATRVVKADGSAVEVYKCELTEWIPVDTPPGMGPDLAPSSTRIRR